MFPVRYELRFLILFRRISRNGDVHDIVVHNNVRLSEVIVSDILDSDHLPNIFHLLDRVRTRNLPDPVKKFTYWERF
jgi:hypothetical protein